MGASMDIDEQKAKKVLDALARLCGYGRCVMPNHANVCFIATDNNNMFTYVFYSKDGWKLLTGMTYADAFLKLFRILKNDGNISYVSSERSSKSRVATISKEHIDMLKFELALEGIGLEEMIDKHG